MTRSTQKTGRWSYVKREVAKIGAATVVANFREVCPDIFQVYIAKVVVKER
jgi:hypothetical protein